MVYSELAVKSTGTTKKIGLVFQRSISPKSGRMIKVHICLSGYRDNETCYWKELE